MKLRRGSAFSAQYGWPLRRITKPGLATSLASSGFVIQELRAADLDEFGFVEDYGALEEGHSDSLTSVCLGLAIQVYQEA